MTIDFVIFVEFSKHVTMKLYTIIVIGRTPGSKLVATLYDKTNNRRNRQEVLAVLRPNDHVARAIHIQP